MAEYSNSIFKPRKDSGFVVKFLVTNKVVERVNKDCAHSAYYAESMRGLDFTKTLYLRKTFNSFRGLKMSSGYFATPWYFGKDVIAFIYNVQNYDKPYAVFIDHRLIKLDDLSDEDRDQYISLSGMYQVQINPLWVDDYKNNKLHF